MEYEEKDRAVGAYSYLEKNLAFIRSEMREAERRSGRKMGETRLLAAVKSATTEEINYLTQMLGVKDIGENRVQQLLARYDALEKDGVRIHFIGGLQKNKVKYIIDKVDVIHSVDSVELAREIEKRAAAINRTVDVYVEINSGREENKGGFLPEEAASAALEIVKLPHVRLLGFMTMAPKCENSTDYYKYFSLTKSIAEEVFRVTLGRTEHPLLSMGMSESFTEAIEEGASVVRVGRQLFKRPEPDYGTI